MTKQKMQYIGFVEVCMEQNSIHVMAWQTISNNAYMTNDVMCRMAIATQHSDPSKSWEPFEKLFVTIKT